MTWRAAISLRGAAAPLRVMRAGVLAAVLSGLALTAGAATAKPPLREVAVIDDGLLAVALADEIRKRCDDIGARMLRALSFINGLERQARDLGYSAEEIEDYVTSKTEKARMRTRGEAYLAAQGVAPDDTAGLCRLGKQEIAKGSPIGALLRTW